jgi:hypothetical protein
MKWLSFPMMFVGSIGLIKPPIINSCTPLNGKNDCTDQVNGYQITNPGGCTGTGQFNCVNVACCNLTCTSDVNCSGLTCGGTFTC